jgi:hypothetical protein
MIAIMDSAMEIKSLKIKEEELLKEVLGKTRWDLGKTARLLKIAAGVRDEERRRQAKEQR